MSETTPRESETGRTRVALALLAASMVVFLLSLVVAAWLHRDDVNAAWPSAALYLVSVVLWYVGLAVGGAALLRRLRGRSGRRVEEPPATARPTMKRRIAAVVAVIGFAAAVMVAAFLVGRHLGLTILAIVAVGFAVAACWWILTGHRRRRTVGVVALCLCIAGLVVIWVNGDRPMLAALVVVGLLAASSAAARVALGRTRRSLDTGPAQERAPATAPSHSPATPSALLDRDTVARLFAVAAGHEPTGL